jgi:cytochrome c peroxidase
MLVIAVTPATAQMSIFGSASGVTCPGGTGQGGVICLGSVNYMATELFFEPEVPFVSLKKSPPTWNEIEQLMDNPYQVASGAACNDSKGPVPGNQQGFPTYCTPGTFIRRNSVGSFGVSLPPMLVHPLNYNPPVGSEMRLLNKNYAGGPFNPTGVCYADNGTSTCNPLLPNITITSGSSRVTGAAIDYDVAIGRKRVFCQANPEPVPLGTPLTPSASLQDVNVCGMDSGEPGAIAHFVAQMPDSVGLPSQSGPGGNCQPNSTFVSQCTAAAEAQGGINHGQAQNACRDYCTAANAQSSRLPGVGWYSTPAIPGVFLEGAVIPPDARLYDPSGRASIPPLNTDTGIGGLKKPTIRGGTNYDPNYLVNTNPDNTSPSNENDFVGLFGTATAYAQRKEAARLEAMRLGKALFWDQQVGSDAVQACGSCHFHAGADNRTKNQVNPNHLGGDFNSFDIPVNTDVTAATFPLHKLRDPEIAGDPLCTTPIIAHVAGISFPDGDPPSHPLANPNPVVCDASNIVSNGSTNDVVSSQGVHFGRFMDVPPIGTFGPASATGGVKSVVADLRSTAPGTDNVDPIPGFQGASAPGTVAEFRRVEPRNTPTIFLAAFNFDNFWDGRARHDYNGGSVFGASDPQAHVFANNNGSLVATRQIIKFASLASLSQGPALSEFEMSLLGRNWAKIGKKLLQAGVTPLANQLVDPNDSILGPYSNQNGGSTACSAASLATADRSGSWSGTNVAGKPGLCISYAGLIRRAFYPALHNNTTQHLNGCYTDGRPDIHPNQCGTGANPAASIRTLDLDGQVRAHNNDPFDGYVLNIASGAANPTDTNQFTQMEANFSLFFGLGFHLWATILVPDDTPWDQFLDANPDAYYSTGETGEPLLVLDLPNCNNVPAGYTRDTLHGACFTEVGNFKRDPGLTACVNEQTIAGVRTCTQRVPAGGTRAPGSVDPLLGMDVFFGSNVSLKNPEFRSARCGECHAPPTLTDHTVPFTHKTTLVDLLPEFEKANPIVEPLMEPLGRPRIISGFLLESEINEPGQDAIERRVTNMSVAPAPVVNNNPNCIVDTCSGYSFPDGIVGPGHPQWNGSSATIRSDLGIGPLGPGAPVPFTSFGGAFFDNGVYNIGVRPCAANQADVLPGLISALGTVKSTSNCDDNGRGNTDAFGWPLSFSALMLKNLGGTAHQPGTPLPTFNPSADSECAPYCASGGLFDETAHDQQINPGFEDEPKAQQLPAYLAAFANKITVGDAHPGLDEACGAIGACPNTLQDAANAEGFPEIPFDPRGDLSEVINLAVAPGDGTLGGPGEALMGTWPMVNRVGRFGSFKAPQLREVELTGPYFHNGGKLTLRQVVDFYTRGGDFPVTNATHRDFNIINLNADLQANLNEDEKVALVDFLLELTDSRVRLEKAPFDHPQMIVPLDGKAPEISASFGRNEMLTNCVAFTDAKFGGGPGRQSCANGMFMNVPATGATGNSAGALPSFLGIASTPRLVGTAANCSVANNHYCH